MKQQDNNEKRYTFPFKLNKLPIVLCFVVLALCIVGIIVSVLRIVNEGIVIENVLQHPFLIAVCIFCMVIVLSLLIKSQYIIDETNFTTQFGIIKSKLPIKTINSIEEDREKEKLTVYCGESFTVIAIKKEWNDEFIRALLAVNPDIDYAFTMTENKPPEKTDEQK